MHRIHHISLILALSGIAGCGDQTVMPTSPRPATGALAAKNPPPGPADVGVTSTVFDADASGALLLTRSDDYNGSGFASYSPIGGVRGGLTSHVSADGAWQLYIGNQTVRRLHLMLADAGLLPPFANGYYSSSVEVASRCFDETGNSLNIQLLATGSAYDNCSLILDFDYGQPKTTYKLAMGPAFANTGRASVTCNAVAAGYCSSWTIAPNDAAANARVAILTAGNGTTSLDGHFYQNSYSVTATK
jgi:hypothetical protein